MVALILNGTLDGQLLTLPTNIGGLPTGSTTGTAVPSSGVSSQSIFMLTSSPGGVAFTTNVCKEPISGSQSANYAHQAILNRSSDVITYSNSTNPTLEVPIELFAIQSPEDENNIIQALTTLRGLTLPYESGVQGPPLCKITLGAGYLGIYHNWPCVMTNVGHTFEVDAGFSSKGQSRVIGVKLSFMGVETDSKDWSNQNFAGLTYNDPQWGNVG